MTVYKKQTKGFGPSKKPKMTDDILDYVTTNDVIGCLSQYVPYLLEESGNTSEVNLLSIVPANNPPGLSDLFVGSLFFNGSEDFNVTVSFSKEEGLKAKAESGHVLWERGEETSLVSSLNEILTEFLNSTKWAVSTFWEDKKGKPGSWCGYTHKREFVGGKAEDFIPDGCKRVGPSPCSEHENLWSVLRFCNKINEKDFPRSGPLPAILMVQEWGDKMSKETDKIFSVDRKISKFFETEGYEICGSGMTPFQPIPMKRNLEVECEGEEWGITYNSLGEIVGTYKGSFAYGVPDFESVIPESLQKTILIWSNG